MEVMTKSGGYGSYNDNLLKQDRYKKYVDDAETPKIYFEGIDEKYEKYVREVADELLQDSLWKAATDKVKFGEAALNFIPGIGLVYSGAKFIGDSAEYFKQTIATESEVTNRLQSKLQSHENYLMTNYNGIVSNCVNVSDIKTFCENYDVDVYQRIKKVRLKIELLREKIGKDNLRINGHDYEEVIDTILEKLEQQETLMSEFKTAVENRAEFVHDFQVAVCTDYCRMYGYPRQIKKWWKRSCANWGYINGRKSTN